MVAHSMGMVSPVGSLVQISRGQYTVEPLDHLEPLQGGLEVAIGRIALGERQCQLTRLLVRLSEARGLLESRARGLRGSRRG